MSEFRNSGLTKGAGLCRRVKNQIFLFLSVKNKAGKITGVKTDSMKTGR